MKTNKRKGTNRERMAQQFDRKSVGEFSVGTHVLVHNPKLLI